MLTSTKQTASVIDGIWRGRKIRREWMDDVMCQECVRWCFPCRKRSRAGHTGTASALASATTRTTLCGVHWRREACAARPTTRRHSPSRSNSSTTSATSPTTIHTPTPCCRYAALDWLHPLYNSSVSSSDSVLFYDIHTYWLVKISFDCH